MQQYIDFASNNPLLILGFIGVLLFTIKLEVSRFTRKYKLVNVNEAVMLLNKDNAVVVDVREDKEVTSGIIKGAKHITLAQLPQKIGELNNSKQAPVLVYCRSVAVLDMHVTN